MKMSFVKKLAVRVYWVLSLVALLALLIASVFPQFMRAVFNNAGTLAVGIIFVAAYVLLAVAMGMMLFAKKPEEDERGFITVESLDTGKVKVAIAAIDQMIRQAAKGVDGISEMKAAIENNSDSISIDTSVIVRSGMHIPTVTANMQNAIRGYIERNCGVAVREVSVSVRLVDEGEAAKRGRRKPAAVAQIEPVKEEAPAEEILPADTAEELPVEELAADEILSEEAEAPEAFEEEFDDELDDEIVLTLDPVVPEEELEEEAGEEQEEVVSLFGEFEGETASDAETAGEEAEIKK